MSLPFVETGRVRVGSEYATRRLNRVVDCLEPSLVHASNPGERTPFADRSAINSMDLLVVGAGAVGRWFAETVDTAPAFADQDHVVARDAAEVVGGRAVTLDSDERFDAICIAVPIPAAVDAIHDHAARADSAVFDVTGIMDPVVEAMRAAAPDCERTSLHPLFAPANEPGNVAVVIDNGGPITEQVVDALETRGNDTFETTPAEHDAAMETVQAKAHVAVLAYALAGDDVREEFHTPVSAPFSDIVDTITGGDPRVYADIQSTFEGADEVAEAARRLAAADPDTFERLYREAQDSGGG